MSSEAQVTQLPCDPSYHGHEIKIMESFDSIDLIDELNLKNKDGRPVNNCDGPPFVSSDSLHFGHLLIASMKSFLFWYNGMNGRLIKNKLGYDCHGLPSEQAANKILGISTREQTVAYGIGNYVKVCKEMISKYSNAWTPIYKRIGRIANYQNVYKTMDTNYMETTWWILSELHKRKLVYRGFKVMPYSTACETELSNFEASQTYKDVKTKTAYVFFPLKDNANIGFVAWTTTPWTLPSNLALCVNPDADYDKITDKDGREFIIARECVEKTKIPFVKQEAFGKGSELVGLEYIPPFNYFKRDKYTVLADTYVKITPTGIDTGIVHIAPAHGDDDYRVCSVNDIVNTQTIGQFCLINSSGNYVDSVTDFAGKNIHEVDTDVINFLKTKKVVIKTQTFEHSVPTCWRSELPLIYKVMPSWFIQVEKLREQLMENFEKTSWFPSAVGENRFRKWLESAHDWAFSRNRYFGTPLPIWASSDFEEIVVISSIDNLCELAGLDQSARPTDLHMDSIDHIQIPSKQGKGMLTRVPDVFDCWFESGAAPLAEKHYPFENKEEVESTDYASDYIIEGVDQTRGWFYTLHVLIPFVLNKPAYKNVVCGGMILDENGVKFSKKHGNFKNPMEVLNKHGSDYLRLYLLSSPATRAEPLWFDENNIDKLKQKVIPWVNATKFFFEHCINFTKKGHKFDELAYQGSENVTDQWIISRLGTLIKDVNTQLEKYSIDTSINLLLEFIDDLTNWYVKFNRDRLKGDAGIDDWKVSLATLYKVLVAYTKMLASATPFLSQHLYNHLRVLSPQSSQWIYLTDYPKCEEFLNNEDMERKMKRLQVVSKLIRSLRMKTKDSTSIRVPLKKVIISHNDGKYLEDIQSFESFVQDELNCINFEYNKLDDAVKFKVMPNNKSLGTKYKKAAIDIKKELEVIHLTDGSKDMLRKFNNKEIDNIDVTAKGVAYQLTSEDFTLQIEPIASDNPDMLCIIEEELMVSIDQAYDEEVHDLYMARLFVKTVQDIRKSSDLRPWNPITIYVDGNNHVASKVEQYKDKILAKIKNTIVYGVPSEELNLKGKNEFEWPEFKGVGVPSTIYVVRNQDS
jgi:isoleucyl-tRNA synthetase